MKPDVSIILPTRNSAHIVKLPLISLGRQETRWRFEIIVVDASDDDSVERIVDEMRTTKNYSYKDINLRYYKQPKGYRLSDVFNYGISLAESEIILQTESDDINSPIRVKLSKTILDDGYDACCQSFYTQWINGASKEDHHIWKLVFNEHPMGMIQGGTFAYTKELFNKVGGYDAGLRMGLDANLGYKFKAAGAKMKHIWDPVFLKTHFSVEHHSNLWGSRLMFPNWEKTKLVYDDMLDQEYLDIINALPKKEAKNEIRRIERQELPR